jgi:plasmid stabilization system protein ParE
MRVRLHPDARAELRDARSWYYERSPLSAIAFAHAVDNAISRIRESPNSFPLADHGTRKFVLQRFPFNIFYRPDEAEIVIVAAGSSKTPAWLLVKPSDGLNVTTETRQQTRS